MNFCTVCVGKSFKSILNRGLFVDEFIRCFSSSAAQSLQLLVEDENYHAQLNSEVKEYASRGQIVNAMESFNMLRMFPGRPTVHDYNQLITCYLESKKVASGMLMELYNVVKLSGPDPNFLTYEIFLNGMVLFGSSRDGVFMAEEMCRSGHRPLFRSLMGLLEKSLELGSLLDSLSLLDLMLRFDYCPVPVTAKRFIASLCGGGMFRVANSLFSLLLEKNPEYFRSACNYSHNQILSALCKCGQLSNALAFFCSLQKKGVVHNKSSYTALIYGFCGASLWEDACRCLDLMKIGNCKPNVITYTVIIKFLCDVGKIKEALCLVNKMNDEGCFPDLFTYNILLRSHNQILWALCKCGQLSNALAFFCSLQKKGVVHNKSSYTALIYGFCGARLWEDAFRCLDLMKIVSCKPNVITYTVIVKFLCDVGKIKEALRLVNKMNDEGCFPDLFTYNILLRELCHQDMLEIMHALLGHINQKGFAPNQFTYASLAGGLLKRKHVPLAKNLLHSSMSIENVTDTAIYNIYLHALCCEHKTEEALCLVKSSRTGAFTPNNISYNTILKGICEEKSIGECLKFFDYIRCSGHNPDLVSYNTMLSAACKERNTSIVRRLLYQMDYKGFELNTTGATSLLLYYCESRKFSECLKLLESMMTNGPNPTILTFNSLIRRLCKLKALNMAHRIFNYLKSFGLSPHTTTYIILIHGYNKVGNHLMVSQLLTDMFSQELMLLHLSHFLLDLQGGHNIRYLL